MLRKKDMPFVILLYHFPGLSYSSLTCFALWRAGWVSRVGWGCCVCVCVCMDARVHISPTFSLEFPAASFWLGLADGMGSTSKAPTAGRKHKQEYSCFLPCCPHSQWHSRLGFLDRVFLWLYQLRSSLGSHKHNVFSWCPSSTLFLLMIWMCSHFTS